jgi:hypothetical protein
LLAQVRGTASEASLETSALLSSAQIASTRRHVVARIPAGGGGAQLRLEIAVAHRIDVTATRRRLRQPVGVAIGGGDFDRRRDGGERGIPQHFDLAAQRLA